MVLLPLRCLFWGSLLTAVSSVSALTRQGIWGFESGEWEEKQYFGEGTFLADFGRTDRWVEKPGKVARVPAVQGRLPLSSSRSGSQVAPRERVVGAQQKTCTCGVDGVGIWGASSLYLVKRLQSGFVASEAGRTETGEGFQRREGRPGKGRGGSGRFPVPFPLWTDASLVRGYHILATWGCLLVGIRVGAEAQVLL